MGISKNWETFRKDLMKIWKKEKKSNKRSRKVRAGVEHILGAEAQMGAPIVRTIRISRARVNIAIMNLAYNIKRFVQLLRRDGVAYRGIK